MIHRCRRLRTGSCSLSDALEADRSFIKNHAARVKITRKGTQIHAAFSRYSIEPSGCSLPVRQNGKHRNRHHQRRDQLHHADAHITETAVDAERSALLRFREEEADVGHTGGEVGAGETAQQRDNHENAKRRGGILNRKAQPYTRHNHDPGAERRPATAAEQRHHKGVRYTQQGARQRRQRRSA